MESCPHSPAQLLYTHTVALFLPGDFQCSPTQESSLSTFAYFILDGLIIGFPRLKKKLPKEREGKC